MENKTELAIAKAIEDQIIGETPTLKAFAEVIGINPVRLYAVAKQPKAGEVYDARVYNWDALDKFFARRLDADAGFETIEQLVALAIEKDKELSTQDRRKNRGTTSNVKNTVDVDGKKVPGRRYEVAVGDTVLIKKDPSTYTAVFVTESHICLQKVDSSELKSLSNWTINIQMIAPFRVAEVLKGRSEGAPVVE